MYQPDQIQQLYARLKTQYPQYPIRVSGDCLTLERLHSKIEVSPPGAKLYVNGKLYDQLASQDVEDPDDLYELMELFLLDLQHAGMEQGNETYVAAMNQAGRLGRPFLIGTAVCLTAVMIGLMATNSPWLLALFFLLPAVSMAVLKLLRRGIFQKYWVCPTCGQPLPMGKKLRFCEMEYVFQCPHCRKVLEQPTDFEPIQKEYAPQIPLEPAQDRPTPGSKLPCLLSGGITIAFALLLLPLIFIPEEGIPLDMAGVGTGVVLLVLLLGFGFLLLRRPKEPADTRQILVMVRERKLVSVLGFILWALSLVLMLATVVTAGTPPFDPPLVLVMSLIGLPFMLLSVWMLLAGRNRRLLVFRDNSILYLSSWGRKRTFAPGQVASVRLTANRSIHLLDKDGKKLASIETNMQGIPQFAQWLENTDLTAAMTPAMEKQARQEEEQEGPTLWREEYRTHWHTHIKGIRWGLWAVIGIFLAGTLAPIPLLFLGRVKFQTIMAVAALAPLPLLVYCLVFAPVLHFGDKPQNATSEWKAMNIQVPLIPILLICLLYMEQVRHVWDGFLLQEADDTYGWLLWVLTMTAVPTVLLILRSPKRLRMNAGLFMGLSCLCIAIGLHYYANAALVGTARHYPAVVVDSHADDPEVDDDDYQLTIVMDNGKEAELVVLEEVYEMAMEGQPLEVCHRESPFGVIFLDIHTP